MVWVQVRQLVHVSGQVVAGADALLAFGGQGTEQPDMLTLVPLPHEDTEVSVAEAALMLEAPSACDG